MLADAPPGGLKARLPGERAAMPAAPAEAAATSEAVATTMRGGGEAGALARALATAPRHDGLVGLTPLLLTLFLLSVTSFDDLFPLNYGLRICLTEERN